MPLLWVENVLAKPAQAHAQMNAHRLGTFIRCSREKKRSRFRCCFFLLQSIHGNCDSLFILSRLLVVVLLVWLFALIVQGPNWPRSRSVISMLPTHLGRFVAFFQDVSSLLRVMSARYYCFNYVIAITGPKISSIPSSPRVLPWEQTGGTVPKVNWDGAFGRERFRLHSRWPHPLF